MYIRTTAYQKISRLKKRIRVIQGGTSASKTVSTLLYLIDVAQSIPNLTISVVAETLPNLRKGALKDFLTIMRIHGYYQESRHNKTENIYTFKNGSYIEFFGADDPDKARGPRRDILFINECNNVKFEVFDQMEVRTALFVILDFNPTAEFWVHTEVMPNMEHDFLKLTYLDNEALSPSIVKSIESRRHNENWWKVYGLGEIGSLEGQVYKEWKIIDAIPEEARLVRYGLDFGYTNDPSGLLEVYKWNNAFILHELLYETGKSNRELANTIREAEGLIAVPKNHNRYEGQTKILTIADSAEPKSIDEIKGYGVKIIGAVKGADSVEYGINTLQDQEIYMTKDSTNLIKESRNYLYKKDKLGKSLNVPVEEFDHLMDPARYAIVDIVGILDKKHNKSRIG